MIVVYTLLVFLVAFALAFRPLGMRPAALVAVGAALAFVTGRLSAPSAPAASTVVHSAPKAVVACPSSGTAVNPNGNVDLVALESGGKLRGQTGDFDASASEAIVVQGWSAASDGSAPAGNVCALVDGRPIANVSGSYGSMRPDVAGARGEALGPTGFSIRLAPHALPAGAHTLRVGVIEDGTVRVLYKTIRFRVAS